MTIKTPVDREVLLTQLASTSPGLTTREILQQSSCFIFKDGRITTFNDEVSCSIESAVAERVTGAVKAEPLMNLLGKLSDKTVHVYAVDGELRIDAKRRKAGITMESEIVLPIDTVEAPTKWQPLAKDFGRAVDLVHQCASKDESNSFAIACVHIRKNCLEACDNFQAARYDVKTRIKADALVRRDSIKHVPAFDLTEIAETENWLHFRNSGGLVVSCKRYTEKYPPLDALFSFDGEKTKLPRAIAAATEKAEVFSTSGETDSIRVELKSNRLRITGRGKEGWYQETVTAEYTGDAMAFMITPKLLRTLSSDDQTCEIGDSKLKVPGKKFCYVTCLEVEEETAGE
jgi:hypothetical protein